VRASTSCPRACSGVHLLGRLAQRDLRQPEVQDLKLTPARQKQICRLDVPVHDALGMGRFQRIGNLDCQGHQHLHVHRLPGHLFRQRLPLQQLHHDEMPQFVPLNSVNGADIGVIQRRGRTRLALKALQQLAVPGHLRREELEGHVPVQLRILGFVHYAHSAGAQFAKNGVVQK
jgi:hypothetical protein